jgi:ubiquinone/menaquinone biosynthesis C-methylase UbiE
MSKRHTLPELVMPAGLESGEMPDLLRYWYLGTRGRRHMMLRRFAEVDAAVTETGGGGRILDIGSAWGFNVMALGLDGYGAVGMDLVTDQFAIGRRIAAENNVSFNVAGADAAALPFPDETFDAVTMVETFEHIFLDDRTTALRECFRVLRGGGRLVLSTPNYRSLVEKFKRFAGSRSWLRSKLPTMCYPEQGTGRSDYHPYHYHHPLPDEDITALLRGAEFDDVSVTHFLFMLKNTPDPLYPLFAGAERILEKTPGLRTLAATSLFTAVKSD